MKASTFRFVRLRILIALALATGVLLPALPVLAGGTRVAVLPFQGPSSGRVRAALVSQLAGDCEVVPFTEIRKMAARVQRPMSPAALWQVVARKLALAAVIKGDVKSGRRWRARLIVNQADSGVSVGSVVISDRGSARLIREVGRTATPRLVALVRKTHADATGVARRSSDEDEAGAASDDASEPLSRRLGVETVDESDDVETAVASRPRLVAAAPPILEASIGPRAIFRSLTYVDNYSAVPGYRLPGAAGVAAQVALYPAAHMSVDGWIRNLGVVGSFESSLGAATAAAPGGDPMPTQHRAYSVGVRSRVPVSVATVLLGADYGEQHFTLPSIEGVLGPEAHYGFVRPTVAGRLAVGRVSLMLSAGYLHILGAAGLTGPEGFPHASIRGGDAGLTLGYAFDPAMQVQLGGDYRRYAYNMNAQMGDKLVVGGALDEYFGLTAMFTYRFR